MLDSIKGFFRRVPLAWQNLWRRPEAKELAFQEKIRHTLSGVGNQVRFLPLADNYTEETAEHRRAYRVMLREPIVKASLNTKVLSVAALDLQVEPASPRRADRYAADLVKYMLQRCKGGTPALARSILLHGLIDGFSVCEKVHALQERGKFKGKVGLAALKAKDTRWIELRGDQYRNITGVRDLRCGQEYHPSNFTIYSHSPLFESPTGISDLRSAYRAYWLKDTAWTLRSVALEQYGLPFLVGHYVNDKAGMEAMLAQARSQYWTAIPVGAQVEALTLASRGTADFEAAIRDLNEEIVLSIAGAVLQMLQGQVADGRGSSEIHRSTAELLQWMLAAEVAVIVNDQIIPELVEWNVWGADYPTATFGGTNDEALAASLNIDEGLLNRIKLPLSKKELYQKYGRQRPTTAADTLQPQEQGGFGLGGMGGFGGDFGGGPGGGPEGGGAPGGGDAGAAFPPQETEKLSESPKAHDYRAIAALQQHYFKGNLPRQACLAHAEHLHGLTRQKALALFPPRGRARQPRPPGSPRSAAVTVPASDFAEEEEDAPAPRVAGTHQDLADAEAVLKVSLARGTALLHQVTRQAVQRLLERDSPQHAKRLFTDAERAALAEALAATNATAHLLGQARIRLRAERTARPGDVATFADTPAGLLQFGDLEPLLPPGQALQYFRGLVPTLGGRPDKFGPEQHQRAFALAGVTDLTLLKKIKEVIARRLAGTADPATAPQEIDQLLDDAGVGGRRKGYASMVFRTNLMDAYADGSWREYEEVKDAFPVWQYLGVRDGRQGKDHAPHFGKYFPASVSFHEVRGPRVYCCRCSFRPISSLEWARLQQSGARLEAGA